MLLHCNSITVRNFQRSSTPRMLIARLTARRLRPRRMAFMLLLVVVLSVLDLVLTLQAMTGGGMYEANPVVRALIERGAGPWAIGCFKLMTVATAVLIVWPLRRHLQAEIGSLAMLLVLLWLTAQWAGYVRAMAQASALAGEASDWPHHADSAWVQLCGA